MQNLSVKEIRQLKAQAEADIRNFIQERLDTLKEQTGFDLVSFKAEEVFRSELGYFGSNHEVAAVSVSILIQI